MDNTSRSTSAWASYAPTWLTSMTACDIRRVREAGGLRFRVDRHGVFVAVIAALGAALRARA
jgi:hypothetical protein